MLVLMRRGSMRWRGVLRRCEDIRWEELGYCERTNCMEFDGELCGLGGGYAACAFRPA
jgi:hypothetical protein